MEGKAAGEEMEALSLGELFNLLAKLFALYRSKPLNLGML